MSLKEIYGMYQEGMKEKRLMYTPYVAVARSVEKGEILTKKKGKHVVGFLRFGIGKREPVGRLLQIFVKQPERRKGIGSKLLQDFEALARKQGMEKVRLKTGAANIPARKFYRQHGYAQVGVRHKKVTELVFEKGLRRTRQARLLK